MKDLHQGLSQDLKTARPTQHQFQNDPSNPFWELVIHTAREPGSDPILRKKILRNTIQWKCPFYRCYDWTYIAYKVTNTHFQILLNMYKQLKN